MIVVWVCTLTIVYRRRGAKGLAKLMDDLCQAAESACQDIATHMQREELQVSIRLHNITKQNCMKSSHLSTGQTSVCHRGCATYMCTGHCISQHIKHVPTLSGASNNIHMFWKHPNDNPSSPPSDIITSICRCCLSWRKAWVMLLREKWSGRLSEKCPCGCWNVSSHGLLVSIKIHDDFQTC